MAFGSPKFMLLLYFSAMNYDALESRIMFVLYAQIKYEIAHVLHSSLSTHTLLNIFLVALPRFPIKKQENKL